MISWLILVAFTAAINLLLFLAMRGRWGRLVLGLVAASVVGTVVGNAIGERLGIEVLRIGSFNLLPASVVAQLAMLATALMSAMAPPPPPPDDEA